MTEPKRWTVHVSEKRANLTGWDHTPVEVVAAADFDRLRDERDEAQDAWERDNREKHEWIENVRQMRAERDEARRVAGVLADAAQRLLITTEPGERPWAQTNMRSALAVFDTLTEEKT